MAFKIIWSPRAVSNLEEICDYISRDSEYYAALFAKKVVKLIKEIPGFPKSGRIVPELPGCMAHGSTQTDALENINEAMKLWIDVSREHGDTIPEPRCHRLVYA